MSNINYIKEWTRPYPVPPEGLNLGLLEVAHYICAEGELYPEEVSHYSAIVWCLEGELTLHCGISDLVVPAGYAGVIKPDTRFSTSCKGERTEFWYMALDGNAADQVISGKGLWQGVFPYVEVPLKWLNYLAEEIGRLERQQTIAALAQNLFEILRSDQQIAQKDKLVWDARCIIHDSWNDSSLNINKLVKLLKTTRSTLTPRFKRLTGQSPQEYLNAIRYENAHKMTLNSSMRKNEIASACGFNDAAYFSRWYKERCTADNS